MPLGADLTPPPVFLIRIHRSYIVATPARAAHATRGDGTRATWWLMHTDDAVVQSVTCFLRRHGAPPTPAVDTGDIATCAAAACAAFNKLKGPSRAHALPAHQRRNSIIPAISCGGPGAASKPPLARVSVLDSSAPSVRLARPIFLGVKLWVFCSCRRSVGY